MNKLKSSISIFSIVFLLTGCSGNSTESKESISSIQLALNDACKDINLAFEDGSMIRTGKIEPSQKLALGSAAKKLSEAARINPQYLDVASIALAASVGDYSSFTPIRNVRTLQALCLGNS